MDMEEQPSETIVNEGVTRGGTPAALASVAPSASNPSPSQDAPDNPVIQLQSSDKNQVASQQTQQPHNGHQQQQPQAFWSGQLHEIKQTTGLKTHSLPLARIKKIMKADSDVPMITGEAPVLFAKACEMTLQKNDVTAALAGTEVFDFLVDIGPSDKLKGDGDDYSPLWSPDESPGPDLRNVTCDDPRYYTYIHEYYSL
ncbi:hypothetical protein PAHAL_6G061600 [Panicum hallii]|uniref:Transcription factor CBF/NF-Y/archaeal histone domain-containing protein n=1 Tax=Panicum hallii TaxID=206008 RepID=A0A2S3I0Z6_9POAL|nr:hypothetical protein PAHAL_6G061600 [Panicum hallii]